MVGPTDPHTSRPISRLGQPAAWANQPDNQHPSRNKGRVHFIFTRKCQVVRPCNRSWLPRANHSLLRRLREKMRDSHRRKRTSIIYRALRRWGKLLQKGA